MHFPRFDWPRISSPALSFPVDLPAVQAAEQRALKELDQAWERAGEDNIACVIVEPVQCEGGDRHLRPEFLGALRKVCDEREALLIFDEVQTGMGTSGRRWLYERLGVQPDLVAFAKRAQTGGVMAGPRLDEVESVFHVRSRISSTFTGNLVDFVRCTCILEVMEREGLQKNAEVVGAHLLADLQRLTLERPELSNPRGVGLLLAFDAPSAEARDLIIQRAQEQALLVLPCGARSVRLRPALDVSVEDAEEAIQRLRRALHKALP